jgi:hypothetical protein
MVLRLLVGLFSPVRLVAALVLVVLSVVLEAVVWLGPTRGIRALLRRVFGALTLLPALLVLGFRTKFLFDKSNVLTRRAADYTRPSHGMVVVVNSSGPFQLLALAARYGCSFALVGSRGTITALSLWPAFFAVFGGQPFPSAADSETSLAEVVEAADGPVCVLVEGATSNGRGVLPFCRLDLEPLAQVKAKVALAACTETPSFPCGNPALHLVALVTRAQWSSITVTQVLDSDVPALDVPWSEWADRARASLAGAAKLLKLTTTASEKTAFLTYLKTNKAE